MNYSTFIKEKLVSLINEMDQYQWLFTRNAEKDFSRIKKWSFEEIMKFIISMEGKSLKDELLEHFNFNVDIITNLPLEEFSPKDIKALYGDTLQSVPPGNGYRVFHPSSVCRHESGA